MPSVSLTSFSRAEDAGYLALVDIATMTERLNVDYRIIGGHMVEMLVAASGVTNVPARQTADADLGAGYAVVADPRLLEALHRLGYRPDGASNRFARSETEGLKPTIDVLAPSYSGRHEVNRLHGTITVDEIPGLALALAQAPVEIPLTATLTDNRTVEAEVLLPGPLPALCLKTLAYESRSAAKDAEDIWRLLEVCRAHGIRPEDWSHSGTKGDAVRALHRITAVGSRSLEVMSADGATRNRIRALVASLCPPQKPQ